MSLSYFESWPLFVLFVRIFTIFCLNNLFSELKFLCSRNKQYRVVNIIMIMRFAFMYLCDRHRKVVLVPDEDRGKLRE